MGTPPLKRFMLMLGVIWAAVVCVAADSYTVDPRRSEVTIEVGKAGALSFIAGHTHEVIGPIASGMVELNHDDPSHSRVRIVIDTSSLKVSSRGEPPGDVPKVQKAMESDQVLDIARYPRIVFESTTITVKAHPADVFELVVAGALTIRDATQPVSVPVRAQLVGNTLTATGRFSIKQTAYQIKPITVGGVVSVKDVVGIRFSITARR